MQVKTYSSPNGKINSFHIIKWLFLGRFGREDQQILKIALFPQTWLSIATLLLNNTISTC